MDITSVIAVLLSTGIVSGTVYKILPRLFDQLLRRDIEKFKIELQSRHDIEIERLRADLRTVAFEHETRFARLHERRAEVVAELYKRLVHAEAGFASRMRVIQLVGEPTLQEKEKEAFKAANDLFEYSWENRLYFEEPICKNLDELVRKLTEAGFALTLPYPDAKTFTEAQEIVFKDVPGIRRQIEKQFREMLGI